MTRTAWALVIAGLALIAAGSLLGYPQLVILGCAAWVAVAVTAGWLVRRLQLSVERYVVPTRVTVGETAMGRIEVLNDARRPNPPLLAADGFGATRIEGVIQPIAPGERGTAEYRLPTSRRGVFEVGPLIIGRSDPLGLWSRFQTYGQTETLYVHPMIHAVNALPGSLSRDIDAPTPDTAPNGTITFHALREYVIGDDLRHIHWKATAHAGTLMVRQHVDTSQPHTTVVLDCRRALHTEASFEQAIQIAASVVAASTATNFPVEVRTSGGLHVDGLGGRTASQVFMDRFAGLHLEDEGSLVRVAEDLAWERGGNSLVVVTAPGAGSVDLEAMVLLYRRYDLLTLINVRPDTGPLPTAHAGALIIDAATAQDFAHRWNVGVR